MKLNKFVQFPLVLGIVGSICAGALGVVYEIANPIIQDRINAEANAAVSELISDFDQAPYITEEFEASALKEYGVKNVQKVLKNNEIIAYAYTAAVGGYQGDPINFLTVLDADEKVVLGYKVISHKETNSGSYGGPLLNSPDFGAQFVGLEFEKVSSDIDFVAGSTAKLTLAAVKTGMENVISFHRYNVLGEINDGIKLNTPERAMFNLSEGQIMVDKTEDFLTRYKAAIADPTKIESNLATLGLVNFIEIQESNGNIAKYAYVVEREKYGVEVESADGKSERVSKTYKFALIFDANWDNSDVLFLASDDSMSDIGFDSLLTTTWVNQFEGMTPSEISAKFKNSEIDNIGGASMTTDTVIKHVASIINCHISANTSGGDTNE